MADQTIGQLIDDLHETREEIRDLEAQVKLLQEQRRDLEEELERRCAREGVTASRGMLASISINESEVPYIEDWNEFTKWMARFKKYELFERRISTKAWREAIAQRKGNKPIPGLASFKKKKVNLRSL